MFNTTCLRSMTGASRRHPDMISNAELFELTGQPAISDLMQQRRLMWLGHVARKPNSCQTKQLMFATAPAWWQLGPAGQGGLGEGRGRRGRVPRRVVGGPRCTWNKLAQRDLAAMYGSQQAAESKWLSECQNRALWRRLTRGEGGDESDED